MEFEAKHIQFKHPCNILVAGPTGSGKTQLIRRFLKKFDVSFINLNKNVIKVLWCYGQWQPLIDIGIGKNVIIEYIQELPNDKMLDSVKPDIVIIDDLMHEINKDKGFENLFIKKSHHLNISVMFLVQNLFYTAKNMRTISLNSHYIILMKNPRDRQQIMTIARQIYPSNTKFLIEAYNDATLQAYGYIRVDLTPDTPEELRVTSRLTSEEGNNRMLPIIYIENVQKP